jgi:hypothetical protein
MTGSIHSIRAGRSSRATMLSVLVGAVIALAGCGSSGSSQDNGADAPSASGAVSGNASAPRANYGPDDPRNPAYWQTSARSVASDFDVAGVKLGMTIEQAVDALQAHGFSTFTNEAQSPPPDGDKLGEQKDGKYTMEAKNEANPAITVKVQFLGLPDDNAKWAMGDAMRVALVDYVQAFPETTDGSVEAKAAIDGLITKAEGKYGKSDEVVLEPLRSDQTRLVFWGNDAARAIVTGQGEDSPMHYSDTAINNYFASALSPLTDSRKSQLVQCRQGQKDQMSDGNTGAYLTDEVRSCMELALKGAHAHATGLAPILIVGPDVKPPALRLILADPYSAITYDINQDHQEVLSENQAWHQHQAEMKKATGNTAF